MTWILQRYRIVFIVLALVMLAMFLWLVVSRQNANKIPSRGVFVIEMKRQGEGIK